MNCDKERYLLFNSEQRKEVLYLLNNVSKLNIVDEDNVDIPEKDSVPQDCCSISVEELVSDPKDVNLTEEKLQVSRDNGLSCGICSTVFTSLLEQRQHSKLDWHRYNIKRKEHNLQPIDEPLFNDIIDGLSSISGSDSEEENVSTTDKQLAKVMETVTLMPQDFDGEKVSSNIRLIKSPKTYFENDCGQVISVYQATLPSDLKLDQKGLFLEQVLTFSSKMAIVMISGGHFAVAVFRDGKPILHKTIHKYVVRAKQGGSQGAFDNKSVGGGAKSAGANLRRSNELSLLQEIKALLDSWENELKDCYRIFYRASGSSHRILFSLNSTIFTRGNPKLVSIPLQTKRPTFRELKNVFAQLTTIEVFRREDILKKLCIVSPKKDSNLIERNPQGSSPKKKKKNRNIDRAKSRSPKRREDPVGYTKTSSDSDVEESHEDVLSSLEEVSVSRNFADELKEFDDSLKPHQRVRGLRKKKGITSQNPKNCKIEPWGISSEILRRIIIIQKDLFESDTLRRQDLVRILQEHAATLDKGELDLKTFLCDLNQCLDEENSTILHVAIKNNHLDLAWALMELGADPSSKDKFGKYPYNCSTSKEARNLFRKFRGRYPDKYDYNKAQVPGPLTDEMEQKIGEKRRLQNKLKREKEKAKKSERKEKEQELDEQKRFLDLSDREKRAIAAERRILAQCKRNSEAKPVLLRCFDCGVDINGKVPFEYNENKFCSTKCLVAHRKKTPTPLSI